MVSRRDVISFLKSERVEDLQRSILFIFLQMKLCFLMHYLCNLTFSM